MNGANSVAAGGAQDPEVLLVAVDDSDGSDRAFDFAVRHLHKPGMELHLVHIVPRLHFAAAYGVPPVDFVPVADSNEYEKVIQKAEQFIINRFVNKLSPDFTPPPVVHIIKSEVDTESVGHILVKKADALDAVALVMSTHNKGRVAEFFLGSCTQYVTHHAHRPVVVVPAS